MFNLHFLNEFGLSDIQIRIYDYLLQNRFGTIEELKNQLNLSYAVVRDNLRVLKNKSLITSSDGKPIMYFRSNPKIALTEALKKKNMKLLHNINNLEETIQANESKKGMCTRNITFYHHSDLNTGIEHIYELIDMAQSEILLSSLPPSLLKKLSSGLSKAFLNGINIKMCYSKLDFESMNNYFGLITDILKNIKIQITEKSEKTCRLIKFNDLIVNEGVILIDSYFNSVLFVEDSFFHFNGFYMPQMATSVKKMLNNKTTLKSIALNPDPIQNVLDIIKAEPDIKTRELGIQTKLSGSKLRQILQYLVKEDLIKEETIKGEVGRPKRIYSVIE